MTKAVQQQNDLDFLLSQGLSLEEINSRAEDGISVNELARSVRSMIARGEDLTENRDVVRAMLDTVERKIDGVKVRVVACTAGNFLAVLQNDNHFRGVRFNTLRGLAEKATGGNTRLWTDADDAESRTYIETHYHISNRQKYEDAFTQFQNGRAHDPIQERINSVVWDGVPRVETMLIKWLKAEDTPYNRECSRLLFAGGINRAFQPGSKYDNVIVLIGKQGGGKSTFCQWLALAPELYSSVKTIHGQKGLEAIQGKWIAELEELLATLANDYSGTKSEEAAKAFLSTSSDFYRKPYDRRPTDNPRHSIFVGTTNRSEFLTDKTGNRRWYPVRVNADGHWLYEHEEECKRDILQAWAEMKAAYDTGSEFSRSVANTDLLKTIQEEQASAEQDDWRVGMIEEYLASRERTCLLDIWQNALYANRAPNYPEMRRRDSNAVSTILVNKLGWMRGNVERFSGYGKQKSFYNPHYNEEYAELL